MNTANAMLSQMVTKVFERASSQNKVDNKIKQEINIDQLKIISKEPPSWMNDSCQDAFMLLQVR